MDLQVEARSGFRQRVAAGAAALARKTSGRDAGIAAGRSERRAAGFDLADSPSRGEGRYIRAVSVGQLSPDGFYRWDGAHWVPVGLPPPPGAATFGPISAAPGQSAFGSLTATTPQSVTERPWFPVGAALAFVGSALVVIGCFVPWVYYPDNSGGPSSSSVFNSGFSGQLWFAIEPIAVVVGAVIAGILLMTLPQRTARTLCVGALLAMGMQTLLAFVGYAGASPSLGRIGAGGIIGAMGGLMILAGGAAGLVGVLSREAPRS